MSPEEIANTLAAMAQVEPFDLTDAERIAWEAQRLARKEREKAEFAGRLDKLRGIWDDSVPSRQQ
jgi:hypothetical protein